MQKVHPLTDSCLPRCMRQNWVEAPEPQPRRLIRSAPEFNPESFRDAVCDLESSVCNGELKGSV